MVVSSRPDYELDDWVDREIASLRQSIEGEAVRQQARYLGAHAQRSRRGTHLVRPVSRAAPEPVTSSVRLPPRGLLALRQACRFVRHRRFEIAFYGICVVITAALVFVAVTLPER